MTSRIVVYLIIIALSFGGGFLANKQESPYITTTDTLKISNTVFSTDTIYKEVINEITSIETVETVYIESLNIVDTIYTMGFNYFDSLININGSTTYRLHSPNTYSLNYSLYPRKFTLETKWTNNTIINSLYENGKYISIENTINYDEYNNYIESIKPPFWDHWYFTIPMTFLGTVGSIYLLNKAGE